MHSVLWSSAYYSGDPSSNPAEDQHYFFDVVWKDNYKRKTFYIINSYFITFMLIIWLRSYVEEIWLILRLTVHTDTNAQCTPKIFLIVLVLSE